VRDETHMVKAMRKRGGANALKREGCRVFHISHGTLEWDVECGGNGT
jgi:hypothetical protein